MQLPLLLLLLLLSSLHRSVPLMMVVGGPVAVKQTHPSDAGFAAAVDDAHARLVDAMQGGCAQQCDTGFN
jgi:hypothetical protein